MRIKLSTVILSLTAASSIYAVPVAPASLEKRGLVMDKLQGLFAKAIKSLECGACVAALVGAKDVAYINKNWVLDTAAGLCNQFTDWPKGVCTGLVYSQGPVLIDAVMQANLISGDGKNLCFQVLGACPAPGISSGALSFPKPKPTKADAPSHSGNQVDVLHLSDWHYDNEYLPGAEADCKGYLCCRKYADSPVKPTRPAATWGDYRCDVPAKLGIDMLKFVPKVANVNFSIFTGDVPPHNIWEQTKDTVIPIEKQSYDNMQAGLSGKVYPTVGNHETGPVNLFPTTASGGDVSWLYSSLADEWSRWLPSDAVNSVRKYGAYTVSPTPGFRIISLNTNFCYTMNFYLYGHPKDYDPNGEIKWLIAQLQAAEDAGERVWIIGHVGPSQTDCIQNWSALYYQVVQRYSPHVIAEQFFGHTHFDEFAISYGPGAKTSQNAISTSWIGPSVTPYTDLNPSFRIYKVDTKSWNVFDSQTYIANLDQAAKWDATGATPNWHLEYSARQTYGAYVPIADNAPLSAAWWHNVTTVFDSNDAAFQKYWTYRGKSANRQAACAAGGPCPKEMVCNLRAGKSSDSCSAIRLSLKRSDEENAAEAADISGLGSVYTRPKVQPWNKKNCGLTPEL
ncbi:hypothetical protein BGZ46_000380 [Entomortierella lignicola]|nr:hypothetical protein BGZ46_000380 [Entomortierella lignicola]